MHALGIIFVDTIVCLFFLGLLGSAVVIIIAFVEDFRELFGSEESVPETVRSPESTPPLAGSHTYAPPRHGE